MKPMDCRLAAQHWRREAVEPELAALGFSPTLVTVRRDGDDASASYERALTRRCADLSAGGLTIRYRGERFTTLEQALALIAALNADPSVHGILVCYPTGLGQDTVLMNAVDPHKDVEGMHAVNIGYLAQFRRRLHAHEDLKLTVPCTAKAVGKLLEYYDVPMRGTLALIINNSLILGRPLGLYLENLGATVVRTFDQTPPEFQASAVAGARLIVTGVPHAVELFREVPEGAVLIHVAGVPNFPPSATDRASLYTDRIGPLTCEMALLQTAYVARRAKAGIGPAKT